MRMMHLWGFSHDERGRAIARSVAAGDLGKRCVGSYQLSGENLNCQVRFDRATVEFDPETHRPFLQFSDGRVKSAQLDLRDVSEVEADMADVQFIEGGLVPAELRWDLSNSEIMDLVDKGLFGFDYDIDPDEEYNPKPIDGKLRVPRYFSENDMDLMIPCDVSVALMERQGRVVPVAAIFPQGAMVLRTNTRVAGCEPMSDWFEEPRFLAVGDYRKDDEVDFRMDEPAFLDLLEREDEKAVVPERPKTPDEKPYIAALRQEKEPEPVLTPEQRALQDLAVRVESRVAQVVPKADIEKAPEDVRPAADFVKPEAPKPMEVPASPADTREVQGATDRVMQAAEEADYGPEGDDEDLDLGV